MQVFSRLSGDLTRAGKEASLAAELGFDGVTSSEAAHDPFLPLAVASAAEPVLDLHSAIAVAFARSPMVTAEAVRSLQHQSGGRMVLGLGTQTKPHIERRFDMPWSGRPVAQMREYVGALRAIWTDWEGGDQLRFEGSHYRHTLMTDAFRPGPTGLGLPAVHLAAVGPAMTRLAGECFDGLIAHSFSSSEWFHQVTLPALDEGLERSGRTRAELAVHCPGFVLVADEAGREGARATARHYVAFYGSTPAYGDVLRLHGWGALHEQLHALSVTEDPQRWDRMAELVDDEVVETFALIGSVDDIRAEVVSRYRGEVDILHLAGVTTPVGAGRRSITPALSPGAA